MDQSPGGSIYLLTPRFNDLIMVAMLSNLSHMFEVGGQRVFWMPKEKKIEKKTRGHVFFGTCLCNSG